MADYASPDEAWHDIIPMALRAPLLVYKHRHRLQKAWKYLGKWTGFGKTNIVVTGRQATGKSVLRERMHGDTGHTTSKPPQKSLTVETEVIRAGKWSRLVRVVPGDDIASRVLALGEAFNKHKKLQGVIHVVNWGYTKPRESAQQRACEVGPVVYWF